MCVLFVSNWNGIGQVERKLSTLISMDVRSVGTSCVGFNHIKLIELHKCTTANILDLSLNWENMSNCQWRGKQMPFLFVPVRLVRRHFILNPKSLSDRNVHRKCRRITGHISLAKPLSPLNTQRWLKGTLERIYHCHYQPFITSKGRQKSKPGDKTKSIMTELGISYYRYFCTWKVRTYSSPHGHARMILHCHKHTGQGTTHTSITAPPFRCHYTDMLYVFWVSWSR